MAMNIFMVSMNVFSKGLCIFAVDLRADRNSDWYGIRSVSLAHSFSAHFFMLKHSF